MTNNFFCREIIRNVYGTILEFFLDFLGQLLEYGDFIRRGQLMVKIGYFKMKNFSIPF